MARQRYLYDLRQVVDGGGRRAWEKASRSRKRMIAANREHPADAKRLKYDERALREQMPAEYQKALKKLESTAEGRKALKRYRKFWGLPFPPEIKVLELPGPKNKTKVLVGMGKTGKGGKFTDGSRDWQPRGTRLAATDADGKRIFLLTGKNSKSADTRLRKVGRVKETHYVPTPDQERAGTFKEGKYWVHRHDDDGGKYPEVFQDVAGNFIYGPGTYRVTDWIRR